MAHPEKLRDLWLLCSEPDRAAQEREELDRRLDEALECTLPANEPFQLSPRSRTTEESD